MLPCLLLNSIFTHRSNGETAARSCSHIQMLWLQSIVGHFLELFQSSAALMCLLFCTQQDGNSPLPYKIVFLFLSSGKLAISSLWRAESQVPEHVVCDSAGSGRACPYVCVCNEGWCSKAQTPTSCCVNPAPPVVRSAKAPAIHTSSVGPPVSHTRPHITFGAEETTDIKSKAQYWAHMS